MDFPLYNPALEHDSCGVGFIADLAGRSPRAIVPCALGALARLAHRGALSSIGAVDGCGLLTSIPWSVVSGPNTPAPAASRALGMFFLDRSRIEPSIRVIDRILRDIGADVTWRPVKVDPSAVLPAQRGGIPAVLQSVLTFHRPEPEIDDALYGARLRIARLARRLRLGAVVVSLSTRTVVYKAVVPADSLAAFYPDLRDPRFESPFAVFHQRFSTNTSANWALAQPFRTSAHNGEINTIAGNRLWMRARLADRSSCRRFARAQPISVDGSDSQSLDDAIGMLASSGYSLEHAMSRLIPPAWETDHELPDDVRAFYEYQSLVSEPWDGPAAVAFADGRTVGAALDRNGFRPLRVVTTAGGLVAVASEAGILAEDEHEIVDRGRLGAGEMIAVDLANGRVRRTADIRNALASRLNYGASVNATVTELPPSASRHAPRPLKSELTLAQRQYATGCSREEREVLLRPMAADGHEAVGSMGDDTPPAVLSSRFRSFTDFFRQRFAQVTNPPMDPYRERSAMSLRTVLGAHGEFFDETQPRPVRIVLSSPVLTASAFEILLAGDTLHPVRLSTTFPISAGTGGFEARLHDLENAACDAVEAGASLVVLSDCDIARDAAAVPALLATSAVHHALIARGLRMRASLVVDTADARDPHQLAVLCAYGASAVFPRLGYETIAALCVDRDEVSAACERYRAALERGLLTIMSKMGVCAFSGYCGGQLFEALGIDQRVVDRYFPGTPSPVGGVTLEDIARTRIARHMDALGKSPAAEFPGLHSYRSGGEYHATNPIIVKRLQEARDEGADAYAKYTQHVYGRPPAAIRDLLQFRRVESIDVAPVENIENVENVDAICRRFFASAMSVGALSPEAHRTLAIAMNRLGARSNSGEGGEEPERFRRPEAGDWDGSRTKQIASARFGVTPAYVRSADELQIKIAQGSKPGEGGQLPAIKVVPHIARLRHASPGTQLISPPVHHDIYSIEDLAQLIADLRAVNPDARINVKLVASTGVGIIAAGVVKAGADAIQISGHDGGTGASPRGSIKHVGLPWEIGLAETQQTLARASLRNRVVLQVDGGLKTGRDIAVAAALGADEYGFGTAALVALGCVMARQCHANTCPVGIATQREDLRARFSGNADMLVAFLRLLAGEVRLILAGLGLTSVDDLIGRADLLEPRADVAAASKLRLKPLLSSVARGFPPPLARISGRAPARLAEAKGEGGSGPAEEPQSATDWERRLRPEPLTATIHIQNTDRSFGARLAGAVASRYGDEGLPDGSIDITATGTAGQSFGAFLLPGLRLRLLGTANDYVGKSMHGGEIIVSLPASAEHEGRSQVVVGNTVLYGATGGRLFVAGAAGDRFGIRNSGATAVVEGVGDHACEYMTGGLVVVLGPVGRNFAAGMSGGVAYVHDPTETIARRCNTELIEVARVDESDVADLGTVLREHVRLTGSIYARRVLDEREWWSRFRKVGPRSKRSSETDVSQTSMPLPPAPVEPVAFA